MILHLVLKPHCCVISCCVILEYFLQPDLWPNTIFIRDMPACRGQFHIQIMCPLSPVIILYFQNNYISAAAGHEETDIKQPKLHDHKTLKGLKLDELISKTSSIDYLSTSAHFWPSHVLCTACTKPVVHISRHHRYICLSYLHSYILMLFLHIFRHCYYFIHPLQSGSL